MSLRKKLLLILGTAILVFLGCSHFIQERVIRPSFSRLENELATNNLTRAIESVQREVGYLDSFTADWGAWDDTYEFVVDGNQAYRDANLAKTNFESGNFDAAYYVARDGTVVWGGVRDPLHDYAETTVPTLDEIVRARSPELFPDRDLHDGAAGLIATPNGPMMVSARPILKSTKEGPSRGWLVLGKWLTSERQLEMQRQTKVGFEIVPLYGTDAMPPGETLVTEQENGEPATLVRIDNDRLCAIGSMRDYAGQPILSMRVDVPRDVYAEAGVTLAFASLSTAIVTTLLLGLLFSLLQHFVLSPIAELTSHTEAVGSNDDLLARIASKRADEFGVLARQFDRMVDNLAESRSKLLEAAREGGRSEIATSVLHNVGNVLNSVTVAKDVLRGKVGSIDERLLDQLLALLLSHQDDLGRFITDDPAGRTLPRFLKVLVENFRQSQRAARAELDQLDQALEHLRTLVAAQQEYAGARNVEEFVAPGALVDQAIRIGAAGRGGAAPTFDRDVAAELPLVRIDKHRVLEALVNLVRNACEALASAGTAAPRIVVRARLVAEERVCFEVQDNGCGIREADMARLFQYGFTTKAAGHGIGLHASANALREIGGSLTATSEGAGKGATFTIVVPYSATAPAKAQEIA